MIFNRYSDRPKTTRTPELILPLPESEFVRDVFLEISVRFVMKSIIRQLTRI